VPDLVHLLRDAFRAVEGQLVEALHDAGFPDFRPGHLVVVRALDPEGMRMSRLARDAGVSRQAVAQVVADLERLGVLEQRPDPADGRAKIVRYTARGRRGYNAAMAAFAAIERRYEERLGSEAMSALRAGLDVVAADFASQSTRASAGSAAPSAATAPQPPRSQASAAAAEASAPPAKLQVM
jgi:DNA-binding MarR family transcriptional regulator